MTGASGLPIGENADDGEKEWAGVPRIMTPKWARLPALTIGLLGVQVLWSVEMSYGESTIIAIIAELSDLFSWNRDALPYLSWTLEVFYGNSVSRRTSFWAPCSAVNWYSNALQSTFFVEIAKT